MKLWFMLYQHLTTAIHISVVFWLKPYSSFSIYKTDWLLLRVCKCINTDSPLNLLLVFIWPVSYAQGWIQENWKQAVLLPEPCTYYCKSSLFSQCLLTVYRSFILKLASPNWQEYLQYIQSYFMPHTCYMQLLLL